MQPLQLVKTPRTLYTKSFRLPALRGATPSPGSPVSAHPHGAARHPAGPPRRCLSCKDKGIAQNSNIPSVPASESDKGLIFQRETL